MQQTVANVEVSGIDGKLALIVDDDELIREIYSMYLVRLGFDVLTAEDGSQALRMIEGRYGPDIDLVLSDVQMPMMTGLELAEHIKNANPEIPVVLTSALSMFEVWERFGYWPDKWFLQKPFPLQQLESRLREALRE